MPSSSLLVIGDRLVLQPGGSRLMLADADCCCDTGGCQLWTRIVQCSTGPTCDGEPPPFVEAWICATVGCIDGRPLAAGMKFVLDGLCWTVQLEQRTDRPIGEMIVEGLDPVECVTSCYDERCPQGVQWLVSRPCNTGGVPVFVCGISVCGAYHLPEPYGCSIVDPADGYIPGSALPPGAATLNATGIPWSPTCCTCGASNGCQETAPLGNLFNPPGECDQNPPCLLSNESCCCETESSGAYRGRIRVIAAHQTRIDTWEPGFGISGAFYGYLGAETIDANGNACYERFIRREGFGGPTETNQLPDLCRADACGWADSGFPGASPPFDPSLGRWFCTDCPLTGVVNVSFQSAVNCTYMRIRNTYNVVAPHLSQSFDLLFEARIDGSIACGGGCVGRALSAPASSGGCAGCGAGATTRI